MGVLSFKMSIINDLLTELLDPYQEMQSPMFFERPELARAVRKSEGFVFLVRTDSKSFIKWHHDFSNKNDFLARPTHCMVRGCNVY